MKLAAPAALLCTALLALPAAMAETSFTEDNQRVPAAPTAQIFEASCDLEIDLRGVLAEVAVRQRIVNPGPDEMAATYEFDLPKGATITGLSLRGDGPAETAITIPARSAPSTSARVPSSVRTLPCSPRSGPMPPPSTACASSRSRQTTRCWSPRGTR